VTKPLMRRGQKTDSRPRLIVTAVVLASFAGVGSAVACSPPAPRAHTVEIRNFAFAPAEVTVAPGDTVVWTNGDFVPHTATGRNDRWDSRAISANGSWRYVAPAPGRYEYYCVFHPGMTAVVIVR
jgi:plastocyanin